MSKQTESSKILYDKHYVKRDPKTLNMIVDSDGEPVPGDRERSVTLHPETVETLNKMWKDSAIIYVEAKSGKQVGESEEGEDLSYIDKMKKDELIENLATLELDTSGTVDVLKGRLKEALS